MKYFIVRRRYEGLVKKYYRYVICYEGEKNLSCYVKSFASLSSALAYCDKYGVKAEYIGNR